MTSNESAATANILNFPPKHPDWPPRWETLI